ncbi:RNA polymerase subunit sigma-24 [Paenibacillus sp. FSL H8-0548]|nr:RNA polymerase subunit sigma-24 [Paenibacillus sp. FSL H8-0548]
MLHIVNGDSVADTLRETGIQGDILVWREIYTEGPVFLQPELPENRKARGDFLEQALGIPLKEWCSSSEAQEKQLADFHLHEDIVLWFEHDLFDQTMLSYLLHWFSQHLEDKTRLHLLSINEYPGIPLFHGLGQLSAAQLSTLVGTWQEISTEQLLLGHKAWEAYTSSTPEAIVSLLEEDTSALPFLHDALRIHLARFPSVHNGLGIIEQTTLELLTKGIDTPLQLFQQTSDKHHMLGMGDIQYWLCLRRLSLGSHPLLSIEGDGKFPGLHDSPEHFLQSKVKLTELGTTVVKGHKNWISLNGIYQWYGGVLLKGDQPSWRWNPEHSALIRQ